MVERLFLAVPRGCLQFVIVVFPDHTHLLFLSSILSLFRNEFNKFNNTRARMLDSIYHMTNTLKSHFWRKNVMISSSCTQRCYGRHNVSIKPLVVYRFYCMALFHSQTRRHMICIFNWLPLENVCYTKFVTLFF